LKKEVDVIQEYNKIILKKYNKAIAEIDKGLLSIARKGYCAYQTDMVGYNQTVLNQVVRHYKNKGMNIEYTRNMERALAKAEIYTIVISFVADPFQKLIEFKDKDLQDAETEIQEMMPIQEYDPTW
jgi:hypothetical protein